ncbi:MAG: glutamate--tRNA ligase, partial [Halolamina sp.]
VQIDAYDVKMSTSTIKELIEAGDLEGWDDPRAPTLKSVRRRGIRGDAIVDAMVELGTSTSNVDLSMSSIYANNREQIDDETDRRFFVRTTLDPRGDAESEFDTTELPLEGGPETATPPLHPDHEERGTRAIPVGDAVLLETPDLPDEGERVWLKGFGAVRFEGDRLVATDDDIDVVRDGDVDVVHWVPANESVPMRMRTMDGDVYGFAEPGVADYESDAMVQFVRVGFARIDRHEDVETVTYFAHR